MVDRWFAKAVSSQGDGPLVFYGDYVVLLERLTASEAEATDLRRKLEEAERERDAMVRGLSALVHCQSALSRSSMRSAAADIVERVGRKQVDLGGDQSPFVARAEIAERKLEEARKALERIAISDDIENALDPARNKRVARQALESDNG